MNFYGNIPERAKKRYEAGNFWDKKYRSRETPIKPNAICSICGGEGHLRSSEEHEIMREIKDGKIHCISLVHTDRKVCEQNLLEKKNSASN